MLTVAAVLGLSAAFQKPPHALLVYSRTAGFRHESIGAGREALLSLAMAQGWTISFSEEPSALTAKALGSYDAVVFLSTTGKFLGPDGEKGLQAFIHHGGGFVGIHAAADAEYDWPWYGQLVGAYFKRHPAQQEASIKIEDPADPCASFLPNPWRRKDEWYDYKASPRGSVHVIASLDDSSYQGSEMGSDHPITWKHEFEGGRSWYTGLGHTNESYKDPLFLKMVQEGIEWACGASRRRA